MKKLSLVLLSAFLWSAQSTFAQAKQKVQVKINKNVEFLGFCYFIGFGGEGIETKEVVREGKKMLEKDWHRYGYKFYKKYRPYTKSKHFVKAMTAAQHLWLSHHIYLLLQVDDFPKAKLPVGMDVEVYLSFSKKKDPADAKRVTQIFLEEMNAFYKEVDFDQYLRDSKKYYEVALAEVKQYLPKPAVIAQMERFYKKSFDAYVLVPSLTIPQSMGFGPRITQNGKSTAFNVFGGLTHQQVDDSKPLKMGFDDPTQMRELAVHEFGHSFVNPVVAQLPQSAFAKTEHLYPPLKKAMIKQNYTNWKGCVYEHFVRAGEIMIARLMNDQAATQRLHQDYVQNRQFVHIDLILAELTKYHQGKNGTYAETIAKAMAKMAKVKAK